MVIIMNADATAEQIKGVIQAINDAGLEAKVMEGTQQKIVGVIGDKARLATVPIDAMPGVETSVAISKSYKLASREFHPQSSVIDVAGVKIGDGTPVVMAGPCAVESKEQLFEAADIVKAAGAQFLRGGADPHRRVGTSRVQGGAHAGFPGGAQDRQASDRVYRLELCDAIYQVSGRKVREIFYDIIQTGTYIDCLRLHGAGLHVRPAVPGDARSEGLAALPACRGAVGPSPADGKGTRCTAGKNR